MRLGIFFPLSGDIFALDLNGGLSLELLKSRFLVIGARQGLGCHEAG